MMNIETDVPQTRRQPVPSGLQRFSQRDHPVLLGGQGQRDGGLKRCATDIAEELLGRADTGDEIGVASRH